MNRSNIAILNLYYNHNTDFMQWFYQNGYSETEGYIRHWILCAAPTIEDFGKLNNSENSHKKELWTRATKNEIVKVENIENYQWNILSKTKHNDKS